MFGTNITVEISISTHTLTWSVTEVQMSFTEMQVISTHTLTWSVTGEEVKVRFVKGISTHTLTWSVTALKKLQMKFCKFQLTRSRGA